MSTQAELEARIKAGDPSVTPEAYAAVIAGDKFAQLRRKGEQEKAAADAKAQEAARAAAALQEPALAAAHEQARQAYRVAVDALAGLFEASEKYNQAVRDARATVPQVGQLAGFYTGTQVYRSLIAQELLLRVGARAAVRVFGRASTLGSMYGRASGRPHSIEAE